MMRRVESDAEQSGRDRGEDHELNHRHARDLGPQANDQSRRTSDNQKAADDLAPANIALFHERGEHVGKWLAWDFRNWGWQLSFVRVLRPFAIWWRSCFAGGIFGPCGNDGRR